MNSTFRCARNISHRCFKRPSLRCPRVLLWQSITDTVGVFSEVILSNFLKLNLLGDIGSQNRAGVKCSTQYNICTLRPARVAPSSLFLSPFPRSAHLRLPPFPSDYPPHVVWGNGTKTIQNLPKITQLISQGSNSGSWTQSFPVTHYAL